MLAVLSDPLQPFTKQTIPGGPAGVKATLRLMSANAKRGKVHQAVYMKARTLTRALSQKDKRSEIAALHAFVRDHIRYVADPIGVEFLQTADKTLAIGSGDCDDKSTLLGALLESIGYATRFCAIGYKKGSFSHVYPQVSIGDDKWLTLETTENWPVGREPPRPVELMRIKN